MLNISRMLTASTENMEGLDIPTPADAPKPHIWLGVKTGLKEAKKAIEHQDLDTAEQLLRETLEFAPAEPETWHILAAILNRKGHVDEARECLRRVIKLNDASISLQTDLPVSLRMAKLLWSQGEHPAALHMLAELLLVSPEDHTLQSLQQYWASTP